jgi:hypothetical protein
MLHRLSNFVKRWRSFILFLIIVGGGFLGFRRLEDNSADTRRLAEENRQLTLQIATINNAQQKALCDSRVQSRSDLRALLLGMVDDFIPAGRPARFELERRINDALGPPPEDCR